MFNSGGYGFDLGALLGNMMGGNRGGSGWGDGNGWWVLIILFALFGGWGNGNFGGAGGSATQGALTRGDLCMDMNFNNLQNGVRNVSDAVNLGFANLNSTICNQQYDTAAMINAMNISNLQSTNALQTQLAQCCCDLRAGQAQAEYNRATDTCAITTAIQQAAQNIINNDNSNYRQLHDEQIALQIQGYKDRIAEQNSVITALNLAASQAAQTNAIVSELRPAPSPAYVVPNPYATYGFTGFNGFNNGCGCCSGSNIFGVA